MTQDREFKRKTRRARETFEEYLENQRGKPDEPDDDFATQPAAPRRDPWEKALDKTTSSQQRRS